MGLHVVGDDRPQDVLAALDGPGPVVVVDHSRPPTLPLVRADLPVDTWLVAFTSGSTARPRAVCRTRRSWTASIGDVAAATGTARGTRVLVPGPLSSTLFLHAAWHARQVDAHPLLRPLHTDEPWDVAHLVPHQLDRLTRDGRDLRGRTAVVAGAALRRPTLLRARDRGLAVVAYYGAAELSFVAVGSEELRAFPGVEVAARHGVLWVRSPYLASGYAGGHGPMRRDDAGWATVGDRGEVRADGTVVVTGRGDEAVQTGGATVDVADVEHAVLQHPDVTDVVVTGVPHDELGQVVAAVVEADLSHRPASVVRAELRATVRADLAPSARPRRWVVVPSLPRTAAGKADRAAAIRLLQPP